MPFVFFTGCLRRGIHRMNMGDLYHHQRDRNTRKEQIGEDKKRERKYCREVSL